MKKNIKKFSPYLAFVLSLGLFVVSCKFNVSNPTTAFLLANLQKIIPKGATITCDPPDSSTTLLSVRGTVRDTATLLAISKVRITLVTSKQAIETDDKGAFLFKELDSTLTKETMNVSAAGYESATDIEINFQGCQNRRVTIALSPVTLAVAGVNPFILDSSKIGSANIQ